MVRWLLFLLPDPFLMSRPVGSYLTSARPRCLLLTYNDTLAIKPLGPQLTRCRQSTCDPAGEKCYPLGPYQNFVPYQALSSPPRLQREWEKDVAGSTRLSPNPLCAQFRLGWDAGQVSITGVVAICVLFDILTCCGSHRT